MHETFSSSALDAASSSSSTEPFPQRAGSTYLGGALHGSTRLSEETPPPSSVPHTRDSCGTQHRQPKANSLHLYALLLFHLAQQCARREKERESSCPEGT
ncbi:hypothetical protein HPB50_024208 [Hyalomma asiaticum]|uniref:Uncharacterized protein n=1 Tax=Hyalomma asiaticum TaxID=266040 RepID=A0ACB7SS99_HYAAI|nr:hypothetical protein HPB50_024208 [Hyalomma asiaticum]